MITVGPEEIRALKREIVAATRNQLHERDADDQYAVATVALIELLAELYWQVMRNDMGFRRQALRLTRLHIQMRWKELDEKAAMMPEVRPGVQ